MDDHRFAADLAARTGRLLLEVRAEMAGAPTAELKDAGDRRAQELLAAVLAEARPGDAVLSEEAVDDPVRLKADRVWIIDPLDGTREFGEPPRTDWAVHVALWERGELVAGAVALPAVGDGVVLSTDPAPPAPRPHDGPPRVVISRSRPPAIAELVARALSGETVALGSAGAKAMAVVTGDAELYVHAGGQYEWDSAAPVAVARAAGLHTSRIDGSRLVYNQPVPSLPDLLICRPDLAERALAAIAAG